MVNALKRQKKAAYDAIRYAAKRESILKYHRDRYRKHAAKFKEREQARRARVKGYPQPARQRPEFCECCGGPPNGRGALNLDHCHRTGLFRGWICATCNIGIGALGDNEAGLVRALEYIRRNGKAP